MTETLELRKELEEKYGSDNVWDTEESQKVFEFIGFIAPFVKVRRKSDDKEGYLTFCDRPRFYYNFG